MEGALKLPGRRLFLLSGLGMAGLSASTTSAAEHVYRFATERCDVRVSVEFHDAYSSRGFRFKNPGDGSFCLSSNGEKDRDCVADFVGSLAIARYEVQSYPNKRAVTALREYVCTIDRDHRLEPRPPFARRVDLHHGIAS